LRYLQKNYYKPLTTVILLLASSFMFLTPSVNSDPIIASTSMTVVEDVNYQASVTQSTDFLPNSYPELLTRSRTIKFINKTRNSPDNDIVALDQIFYRLATIKTLDPTLGNLSSLTQQSWVDAILSFQNPNGGFGAWKYATSSVSDSYKALQALTWLNYTSLNTTVVEVYLERVRNSLTSGFNRNLFDTDSDVISTHYGVLSYELLGITPPNSTKLVTLFQRAQNLNSSVVPSNEIGGFGLQTNDPNGINWISEVSITKAAVLALASLNSSALDSVNAISFVQGMQTISGGFVNNPNVTVESVSYTTSAIQTLDLLGGSLVNVPEAQNYLLSMELPDGGFKLKTTSTSSSLKATFFAIKGLDLLGSGPSNITKTLEYLVNWTLTNDGYGGHPGETSSLRETFDAVAALTLSDTPVYNTQSLLNFVNSYRNPDGGYGITGSFTESTLRTVEIYNMLGDPFPNPQETITFLQGLQQSNGGFSKKTGSTVTYVVSSYRAIRALEILGALPIDVAKAIDYLKSNQNSDGGFGGFVGDTSDISSTYRAVRALNILGSTPTDVTAAIQFLKNSQNPDGGFKRSTLDVIRPKNTSNIIYSYSAFKALRLLNSSVDDPLGLYNYIVGTRNRDGGYGEHPYFTSDVAYTFVSFWMLRYFKEISGFSLRLPDNLDTVRDQYSSFTIEVTGSLAPFKYTITIGDTASTVVNGTMNTSGSIIIDTSGLTPDTYSLSITVNDLSGTTISADLTLLISTETITTGTSDPTTTTSTTTATVTTTEPKTSPVGIISIIIGILSAIWLRKKKLDG